MLCPSTTLRSIALFALVLSFSACDKTSPELQTEQIQNEELSGLDELNRTKVFRSVLDGKSRVLNVPLDKDFWAAYDTESATVFKIWQGEPNLSGTVFDQAHGPQPTSAGVIFISDDDSAWHLRTANGSNTGELQYLGHRFDGKQLVLMSELRIDERSINIEERPSATLDENQSEFTRSFKVRGLAEGEQLVQSALDIATQHSISGASEISAENTANASVLKAKLLLKNGESTLTQTFAKPAATEAKEEVILSPDLPGKALVASNDCVACHNETKQTVGPSYLAIARRYRDSDEVVAQLSDKIIEGGSGVWGPVAMTAHPNHERSDIEFMTRYILSLDDAEAQEPENSWDLGEKGVPAQLKPETPTLEGKNNGMFVYLHYFSGDQPSPSEMRANAPSMAAHTTQVHMPTLEDYSVEKVRFAYQILGDLVVKEGGSRTLRLISDDGAYLYLNGERVIENWGFHGPEIVDATVTLESGNHPIEILFFQGTGGASLSLQWFNNATSAFELIPSEALVVNESHIREVIPKITDAEIIKSIPGDASPVAGVHPSFDLKQARPAHFEPMVSGLDLLDDGRLVVTTWDPEGSVYIVDNYRAENPEDIKVKKIANGLAEPLGVQVVDGDIYVMQKQELTRLVDDDGDDIIDRYLVVANGWPTTDNFHEFSFGLEYRENYFYATLATAILPGGASANPQLPNRGSVMKVHKDSGAIEYIANGLRTPNGIGEGIDGELFIADNQGDWLPSSKIVEVTDGAWYGSRSVDFEGTANKKEIKPVVWLPQDEIGNSPSEPSPLNLGPYQNQMIHGEVTHGGIKRVYAERVNGRLQGAVFRFVQGLEAGVNRLEWNANDELIVGGIGNPGNWSHDGHYWYGLQRLVYNGNSVFEMLSVSARSNGFEIEFTEAIKAGQHINAEDFLIQQWYYEPSPEYGGPKKALEKLKPTNFSVSDDGRKVVFELPGIKEDHVVYFRIVRPFSSAQDHELWTTEAWYTLNAIPENKPVEINPNYVQLNNQLSENEKSQGWELLFDGKSLDGIRNYNSQSLGERWVVDKGTLHLTGKTKDEEGWQTPNGGDIVIAENPSENYELYLEWKLKKHGNSGIIYNVLEDPSLDFPFLSGPEFQLLDNTGHPDGQIFKHRAGDNYDLIPTKFVTVNEAEEWNRVRLIVNKGKVEHWLNGYKVVETDMNSEAWRNMLAESKFKDWPEFGKVRAGKIVLQDHSDKVWFRNIKLRKL